MESSVLHCPPSGTQHSIHFSSAISAHLVVTGKVLNRTGKALNSPKHNQVLFILVQALSLSTGTLGFGTGFCARSSQTPFPLEGVTLTCRTAQQKNSRTSKIIKSTCLISCVLRGKEKLV